MHNIPDILLALHIILVIALTLRILWRDDLTPVARLAWFIVVMMFPYVGVVIYWMLGEVNLGEGSNRERQQVIAALHHYAPEVLGAHKNTALIPVQHRQAFYYAASVNGFHTTLGNDAELMKDASATHARMIADFNAAIDHIHVIYYIWLDDEIGTNTAYALMRAAKRGVACRAMADALGSRAMIHSGLWQQMEAAGVEVQVTLPVRNIFKTLLFSRIDLRNHRKITVIDGKIAYCGSQNCADPAFRVEPKYAPWVDIMLRFEGPVVAQTQMLFASDWLSERPDTALEDFVFHTDAIENGFPAQVFGDGPTERRAATPQLLTTLIGQAQHALTISTPYFVPDYSVLSALCSAAYRGVQVTLIFPKRNNSFVVAATSRSYYRHLLEAGVKIYEFTGGLLHAKTLTIDGMVTLVGSTNIDLRSFDLNYENNILLYDARIHSAVCGRQQEYIQNSEPVLLDCVLSWPVYRRILNNVIATIGPLL